LVIASSCFRFWGSRPPLSRTCRNRQVLQPKRKKLCENLQNRGSRNTARAVRPARWPVF